MPFHATYRAKLIRVGGERVEGEGEHEARVRAATHPRPSAVRGEGRGGRVGRGRGERRAAGRAWPARAWRGQGRAQRLARRHPALRGAGEVTLEHQEAQMRLCVDAEGLESREVRLRANRAAVDAVLARAGGGDGAFERVVLAVALNHQLHVRSALLCEGKNRRGGSQGSTPWDGVPAFTWLHAMGWCARDRMMMGAWQRREASRRHGHARRVSRLARGRPRQQ